MIIVSGLMADEPVRVLLGRLAMLGYEYTFLDQASFPTMVRLDQRWAPGEPIRGDLTYELSTIDFDQVTGVYIRYNSVKSASSKCGLSPQEERLLHAEKQASLGLLFDYLPCGVVNRLRKMISNDSKPVQALLARAAGFRVPRTLITSDPDLVLDFWEDCGRRIIYKAISGTRTLVRQVGDEDVERLHLVRNCPVQFQEYVPGPNVRVHVVGDRVFALKVLSDEIDYRYARNEFVDIQLPDEVSARCVHLTHHLGLLMSGIDLIDRDGEYFFLEANPMPGFSYFEIHGYQPISEALAELLRDGHRAYERWIAPRGEPGYDLREELEELRARASLVPQG